MRIGTAVFWLGLAAMATALTLAGYGKAVMIVAFMALLGLIAVFVV